MQILANRVFPDTPIQLLLCSKNKKDIFIIEKTPPIDP